MTLDWLKKLTADAGLRYAATASKDPKFIEDMLRGVLDTELKKGTCFDMKEFFDKNENIIKQIDIELINQAKDLTQDHEQFKILAKNIENHMWRFDNKWLMKYLEEKHPDFFMIIKTDAEPKKFEEWITNQIQNVSTLIMQELGKNK